MNLSKRDQKLLLVFVGILVFIAAWLGIRNNYNAKADALISQAAALEPRLSQLREHEANIASYESGITEIAESVTTELSKFPNDVRSEDMIMYASGLETALGLKVGSISFIPPELLSQFNVPLEGANGAELVPYAALRTGLTVSCDLDYTKMKKLVSYIYTTPQRTTLESISVSYNSETGGLTGSATLSKFFMNSDKYVYVETTVPNVPKGTSNPFGTIDKEANITESPSPSLSPLPSPNPTPKPSQSPSGGGSGSGTN